MQKSKIEWTDFTWNPITGCINGCSYCYAAKMARNPYYAKAFPFKFAPHFYPERLDEPMKLKKSARIFVCSMSDLFGKGIPEQWTWSVLNFIESCPQHTFQLLTKQPQNLSKFLFPDNCWVGVSTNGNDCRSGFEDIFTSFKAKVKFVSIEPLLDYTPMDFRWVDWAIIGQCTPVKPATSPKIEWVRDIVEAADKAGCTVFLKDNLEPLFKAQPRYLFNTNFGVREWVQCKYPVLRQEFPKDK